VIAVFFNPAAGAGERRDLRTQLAALFAAASLPVQLIALDSSANTAPRVRSALASGAQIAVAAGGDGTVSGVASALVDSSVPLGVIPLGTLNHFAKDAGIPLDAEGAVRTIASGHVMRVDAGEVSGRVFLNNASIGVYPDIVMERESLRARGRRKWVASALASATILSRYRGVVVQVRLANVTKNVQTPFLFVGNNEYQVEGPRVGRRARLDAGQLFVYLAPRLHGRDLPGLALRALAGRLTEGGALESFAVTTLDVSTRGRPRVRVALDGELTVLEAPLHFRVRPAALGVIVPVESASAGDSA
jgi:diacylglycerol kinase family enzyme